GSVASGAAAVYLVRDGVALGLNSGANGEAWGYDLAAGRVTWSSAALPWPHFYSDLSGLGGSAAASGGAVVVPVAVWSKFKDDRAGNLAALIAYYAFAALFPLLLVLVTVLNIVLRNDPSLRDSLLNSALSQYPVIGPQIKSNLGSIGASGLPLVIGIVFLVLGAR